MTRIDAHQHFWQHDPVRDTWITDDMSVLRRDFLPAELEPQVRESRIEGTIVVQADQSERETEFLLGLAERHPFIRGVVGWVDLRADDLPERLAHFSTFERFRGVRHVAQAEPDDFLARDDVVRGIRRLREFDLTYDILVYEHQFASTHTLVERLPDQPFVVDHLAKPRIREGRMEPWATHMRRLAEHPNVCCKVSGLVTEADWRRWRPEELWPYLDVVFEAFGTDRLMFGSDWPVCLLAASYPQVVELIRTYTGQLSPNDQERLFGGTATEFYGLTSIVAG
ncbi:MAG: amidohydrolase family protein [Gemmatimonadales bacterium]|jgi:L-fuconolactonase